MLLTVAERARTHEAPVETSRLASAACFGEPHPSSPEKIHGRLLASREAAAAKAAFFKLRRENEERRAADRAAAKATAAKAAERAAS